MALSIQLLVEVLSPPLRDFVAGSLSSLQKVAVSKIRDTYYGPELLKRIPHMSTQKWDPPIYRSSQVLPFEADCVRPRGGFQSKAPEQWAAAFCCKFAAAVGPKMQSQRHVW